MKRYSISLLMVLIGILVFSIEGNAAPDTLISDGTVQVIQGSPVLVDPEKPDEIVDPGQGPSTIGDLRIDFVSSLDFGKTAVSQKLDNGKKERVYNAMAQTFISNTNPRGSYIQITDQRAKSNGWTIQVKQNYQFRNSIIQDVAEQELRGAEISLDKGWANSSSASKGPIVTRETMTMAAMDTYYQVATARQEEGKGTWLISFGASGENKKNQENTIKPLKNELGELLLDEQEEKPVYSNSAVSLRIPENIKIHPVEYETTFTWVLGALP